MASGGLVNESDNQILIQGNSRVRVVVLNRPTKYNVLTYSMLLQLINEFKNYEEAAAAGLVIVKSNGKAFCAGGDAVVYYDHVMQGRWDFATHIYKTQLILDYLVATCSKPQVFLLNGFIMGGGAGLSMNGRFRIATENSVFAMPEAALGLFPDVGASYFLSQLPGFLGEYLGLTGARLDGAEMLSCGLATHFVPSKNLPLLEKSLCEMDTIDPAAIEETITEYVQPTSVKGESVIRRLDVVNKCFSQHSVEEILSCLEQEAQVREEKWITDAIKLIKMASPISLKLFLVSIRKGRHEEIEQCLMREYRMVSHVMKRAISDDYFEGVRAKLLDKDNKPKWEPPKLEMVGNDMVEKYFSELPKDEGWEDLHLPIKSLPKTLHRPKL